MKNLVCLGIDQSPPDWSLWRKTIDRSKYFTFDINTFPDSVYFCNVILNQTKNYDQNNNQIQILERIGSQSADAEVYKIKFKDSTSSRFENHIEFAMKIMPRIDNDSLEKNKKELQIAEEASKYPNYFPLTFAKGYCSDASFYVSGTGEMSPFINKAREYYSYNKIKDFISNSKGKNILKRFENDYRSGMNLNDLKNKYVPNITSDLDLIEADFLISELCNMDLGTYMKISHSMEEWKIILKNIIEGIYYMTIILNIVHPDLHVGNILINTNNKKEPLALIHDFGRCYIISDLDSRNHIASDLNLDTDNNENNNQMYKGSLYSFCSEFISCTSTRNDLIVPRNVLIAITDIFNYINKTSFNRENLKDIYDTVIIPIINSL